MIKQNNTKSITFLEKLCPSSSQNQCQHGFLDLLKFLSTHGCTYIQQTKKINIFSAGFLGLDFNHSWDYVFPSDINDSLLSLTFDINFFIFFNFRFDWSQQHRNSKIGLFKTIEGLSFHFAYKFHSLLFH